MKHIIKFMQSMANCLKIVLVSFLLISMPLNSIFFYGRMWEKTDNQGKKHYIVGLGDWHIEHMDTSVQIKDLMSAIPLDSYVIVECMTDLIVNTDLGEYKLDYQLKLNFVNEYGQRISLSDLIFLAKKLKIACRNIEFRKSYGDFKQLVKNNSKPKIADVIISIKKWCNESFVIVNSLKNKDQLERIYNENYKNSIAYLTALLNFSLLLEQKMMQSSMSLEQEFDQAKCSDMYPSMSNFFDVQILSNLMFNTSNYLLDAFLLDEIVRNQDKQTIFICVGAQHLRNVEPALQQLGYTSINDKNFEAVTANEKTGPQNIIDVQSYLNPYFPRIRWIDQCGDEVLSDNAARKIYAGLFTTAALSIALAYKIGALTPDEFKQPQVPIRVKPERKRLWFL